MLQLGAPNARSRQLPAEYRDAPWPRAVSIVAPSAGLVHIFADGVYEHFYVEAYYNNSILAKGHLTP